MRTMQPKPKAALAIEANNAAEQRDKEKVALLEFGQASAQRIEELTELVADLRDRVEQLESRA